MRLVIDASVVIKFYIEETDSIAALRWIRAGSPFSAPDILLVEVAQALLRHHREGRLGESDMNAAIGEVREKVTIPATSGDLIERGLQIAQTLTHRLHDCMYLALAERLRCPLLTADERLARKKAAELPIAVTLHTETAP